GEGISRRLLGPAARGAAQVEGLLPHLYLHYDDGAVSHLFRVAAGLDSMAVGEAQILGQTRAALVRGQEQGTVGPVLNTLFQQALRVGKRVHAETGIDRAAPTLVSAALDPAPPSGAAGSSSWVRAAGRASPSRPSYDVTPARWSWSTAAVSAVSAWPVSTTRAGRRWPTSAPRWPVPTSSWPAPERPGCWSATR